MELDISLSCIHEQCLSTRPSLKPRKDRIGRMVSYVCTTHENNDFFITLRIFDFFHDIRPT